VGERQYSIGEAELEVLKVLWEHGPGTVREINARLEQRGHQWAYTTVQTMLHRLQSKGCVRSNPRDRSGAAHIFAAIVSRERLLSQRLRDLANQLCGGTSSPLLLALVEGQEFTAEDIRQFRRLLDQLEKPNAQQPSSRKR
jgi:BlaI family transcriptional regulator, penicillinase repressor